MEASLLSGYYLVVAIFLLFTTKCTEAVECYVCSWSPVDHNSDVCSGGNFDPLRVHTHECDNGCEIVSMKDKNGELEMFYRNCVTNEKVTYDEIHRTTKLNEEKVYTCDSRLCNAGLASVPTPLAVGSALCASLLALRLTRGLAS